MQEENHWYVVYTRPRWEKKVALNLESKGIRNYCPLNRVIRQWSDRKKMVMEPLFKGYVFVNVSEQKKWEVKQVDGIINYVYWLGKPAVVQEEEIDTIRKFLSEFTDVSVEDKKVEVNSSVVIKQGVLMSYRGNVIQVTGNKAKVEINSMGIYLTAYFDKDNLVAIG